MPKHTPAPWQPLDIDGRPIDDLSVASEKHILATVWINDLTRNEAVANARLMAAAPDMLAALKIISGLDLHHEALNIVDAAIAKAEGGKC